MAQAVRGTADLSKIEAPINKKAYLICVSAAFGGIFFGYDIGWMSGVLGMPYFIQQYTGMAYDWKTGTPIDATDFVIPSSQKSLITCILSLGTFLGALIAGDLADAIGRRLTIIIGCAIFTVGVVLQIASTNQLALICMGRLVAGFGVGFESAVVIMYMSEVSPRKIRGAVVSAYQFCVIPIGIQFAWALILASILIYLPESPRYFVKKGQIEKALKSLCFIRGQTEDSEYVQDELAEIVANLEYESQVIPYTGYVNSWLVCFKGPITKASSNVRRIIVGAGIQAMQQLTGMNFIFYFGTTFFQQLGTIQNPFLISLITTLVNVCATPLSFWTIEKFGRRPLLIYGGIAMFLMQFIIGAIGTAEPDNPAAVKAMIAVICFQIFCFATTWGPTAWVVVGEVFALPIRSRGIAISTASCWFWNCVLAVIAPYMTGTVFAYFLVPEMKGHSLEQVDQMLEDVGPRKSAGWAPQSTFAAEMGHVSKPGSTHIETAERIA
ncbi:hypothetical protein N7510_002656 [Penicillium lagena]|uniref:uncharacterized protein n=1 Tax=Penicillium lagena TaxID=94218 RepID=UPI00253FC917|nr:uncharacterized protein N7510_002656 [Penicillium lagena]KAJ5626347.1 hypothetical protein N7510_002656 [Penicillium lagena]